MGCGLSNYGTKGQNHKVHKNDETSKNPQQAQLISPKTGLNNYIHLKKLGKGAFSEVVLSLDPTSSQKLALKIIKKQLLNLQHQDTKYCLIEAALLKEFDHPNIVKFYETSEDKNAFYIALEYCKGGNLLEKLKILGKFDEKTSAQIMSQIFSAVDYIHKCGVIHRDLKLENILFGKKDKMDVKIADFGSSYRKKYNERPKGIFGTQYCLAPEVFSGFYTEKVDIWSCGIILLMMMTGKYPYFGTCLNEVKEEILALDIKGIQSRIPEASPLLLDFLSSVLDKDTRLRFSAKDALGHPWILCFRRPNLPKSISRNGCFNGFDKAKLVSKALSYISSLNINDEDMMTLLEYFRYLDEYSSEDKIKEDLKIIIKSNFQEREADKLIELFKNIKDLCLQSY
ncbi:hypothetical protein SteCoe_16462 [Stentor coeruleus]|uniref:Protein kinase domain-containing protein n=1 Tax=Stentor coeruleus TaxID=5963 RepID=A0A1R2C197_9CILI|nr:hypothetical protein SteCoe_16462 [Stentor coeruleus]